MIVKKNRWGTFTPWRNYFVGFINAPTEILNKQPDRKTRNAGMMAKWLTNITGTLTANAVSSP